ncbi:hypothetical protein [Pseudomonas fluorescens]|uniref:hypothetical protein n=1 Tax=Pseudomonas fluorescens TaxID=294 RepID=UPI001BEA7EA2|nr:hypothetical protein [Pseudomonas fluorescens]MBT2375497.1 hypothetical protein [Pseudomonas fluorescens]
MKTYSVSWTIDIETDGDDLAAAQIAAEQNFQAEIAAGNFDSACVFLVTGPDLIPVTIDLASSLSDLDGDDTQ